eukprot:g3047.t1
MDLRTALSRVPYDATSLPLSALASSPPLSGQGQDLRTLESEMVAPSDLQLPGRMLLNVWRLLMHLTFGAKLRSFAPQEAARELLGRSFPKISLQEMDEHWSKGSSSLRLALLQHVADLAALSLEISDVLEIFPRAGELSRLFGMDILSGFTRGTQLRVESLLMRVAHAGGFRLLSASQDCERATAQRGHGVRARPTAGGMALEAFAASRPAGAPFAPRPERGAAQRWSGPGPARATGAEFRVALVPVALALAGLHASRRGETSPRRRSRPRSAKKKDDAGELVRPTFDFAYWAEHVEEVQKNADNRQFNCDVAEVVAVYQEHRSSAFELQQLAKKRNEHAKSMKGKMEPDARQALIEEGKKIKEDCRACQLDPTLGEWPIPCASISMCCKNWICRRSIGLGFQLAALSKLIRRRHKPTALP